MQLEGVGVTGGINNRCERIARRVAMQHPTYRMREKARIYT